MTRLYIFQCTLYFHSNVCFLRAKEEERKKKEEERKQKEEEKKLKEEEKRKKEEEKRVKEEEEVCSDKISLYCNCLLL